jgi:hypothetical protein
MRDTGGEGRRRWALTYTIFDLSEDPTSSDLNTSIMFQARNNEEAKRKILKFLQRAVASMKPAKDKVLVLADLALPLDPRKGESICRAEDIIRLKHGWDNMRLLRVKNPNAVLVQGYGPEALKRLG